MQLTHHLNDLYLLVQIIDAGGYAAAGRKTGTSRSLLSRRIQALEKALGTQLLYRDARHLLVTPAGEKLYRHALTMCDAVEAADASLRTSHEMSHAALHVGTHDALDPLLNGVMTAFGTAHPQIQLSADTNHDIGALLQHRADVVFHLGRDLPAHHDITTHHLGNARWITVASHGLLEQLHHPKHPNDVDDIHRLGYTGLNPVSKWTLRGAGPQPMPRRLTSHRLALVLDAARAGMGVAQLPMHACHEDLASGRLALVFEAFEAQPIPLYALTHVDDGINKLALDFLRFTRRQLVGTAHRGLLSA